MPTSEFAPSRFQLLKDIWEDIRIAVTEAVEDEKNRKQVLAKIKQSFCDRLFPIAQEN